MCCTLVAPIFIFATFISIGSSDIKNIKNGLVCYDEAHHVVSPEYKKLIFEKKIEYFEKEVYFTATPKNENNVIMFDRDEPQKNMCGVVAYEYTYLQGLYDEFLNAFDVCIDMYTYNLCDSS